MKVNLLKTIIKFGWKVPIRYVLWIKRYAINKNDKYPMSVKYKKLRHLATELIYDLDADIIVKGLDNVPNEICAFFSNHLAAPDPLPIIATLERPMTFLAKSELEHFPFVCTAINDIEGLYIHRDDLKSSLRTMMKIEEDLKKGRKNWLIFPEGTRNKDDRSLLLEFHHGTFRPAMKAGVPLVPTAVFGCQRLFNKNERFKKYPIHLIFGKPIYPEEYKDMTTQDVAKLVQSKVQQMLAYEARKDDRAYLAKMLGNKFKENL